MISVRHCVFAERKFLTLDCHEKFVEIARYVHKAMQLVEDRDGVDVLAK
jgi:hypothetical protein